MKNDKENDKPLASTAGEGSGHAVRSTDAVREDLDIYARIMRAAERGKGLRLSPDDVFYLSLDTGIIEAAFRYGHKADLAEDEKWRRIRAEDAAIAKALGSPYERTTSPDPAPQPPFNPSKDSE